MSRLPHVGAHPCLLHGALANSCALKRCRRGCSCCLVWLGILGSVATPLLRIIPTPDAFTGRKDGRICLIGVAPKQPSRSHAQKLHAVGSNDVSLEADIVWKEAYGALLERNALLRERLMQEIPGVTEEDGMPGELGLDWEVNYNKLKETNADLEARLRRPANYGISEEEMDARVPLDLKVQLATREASVQVFRLLGANSSFYTFNANLPLGLNITRPDRGDLRDAFVIDTVLPQTAAARTGVKSGDVLHALSTQISTMGVTTFDSGVMQNYQHLVQTCFLSSVEELVEAIGTNGDAEVVLLLERKA